MGLDPSANAVSHPLVEKPSLHGTTNSRMSADHIRSSVENNFMANWHSES
jgi:hypothetical protein